MNEIGLGRDLLPLGLFGHNWSWYSESKIRPILLGLQNSFEGEPKVIEYLRAGAIIHAPMEGMTRNVISGEKEWVLAGNSVLTDGTFFWRGDTADYVETYQIGLRQEFMIHGLLNKWEYQLLPDPFHYQRVLNEVDYLAAYRAIMDFLRGESPSEDIRIAVDGEFPVVAVR